MKRLWFRAKDYGWGWRPASWQGWLSLIVFVTLLIGGLRWIDTQSLSTTDTLYGAISYTAALIFLLIALCAHTGERPQWRWDGKPVSAFEGISQTSALLISIGIAELGGALGSLAVIPNSWWYISLSKPLWMPPAWVFGPAWFFLYATIGAAAYVVWHRPASPRRSSALRLYAAQLVLNFAWTPIFFGLQHPLLGLITLGALIGLTLLTLRAFWRVNKPAALLFLPYCLWVGFAFALNLAIIILN